MRLNAPLDNLEISARTARTAANLVAFALVAVAALTFLNGSPLPAIGLILAAGTLSHTARTLGAVTAVLIDLAADVALDHDIIRSQNEVIVTLRTGGRS